MGANTTPLIGTVVPNSGNTLNGLFLSGDGIADTTYTWPTLSLAPRVGAVYDISGDQSLIIRGGGGLYFDRPTGNSIYPQVQNPPTIRNSTVRYTDLQSLGSGLSVDAPPALSVFEYDRRSAIVGPVEHRRADDAAVGVGARCDLRRAA